MARFAITASLHRLAHPDNFFDFHPAADADETLLPDLLADCIEMRMVSDRPVGLLLSGGTAGSLILSAS
jgi:asparagine synthetase B (glutamine-hydrolysing)